MYKLLVFLSTIGLSCKHTQPVGSELASIETNDALYFSADNGETVCRLSCPGGECIEESLKALNAKTFFQIKGVSVPLLNDLYSSIHSLSVDGNDELHAIALKYAKDDIDSTLAAIDQKFSHSTNKKALGSCLATASQRGAYDQIAGARVGSKAVVKAKAKVKAQKQTAQRRVLPKRYRTKGHATDYIGCVGELKAALSRALGRYGFAAGQTCEIHYEKSSGGLLNNKTSLVWRYTIIKNGVKNPSPDFKGPNPCIVDFAETVAALFPESHITVSKACTDTFRDNTGDDRNSFEFSFVAWPGVSSATARYPDR